MGILFKQSQVQSYGFTSVKGRDRTPAQIMPSLLFMEESMPVLWECLSRGAQQSSQSSDTHLSSRHLEGGGRKVTLSCTVSSKQPRLHQTLSQNNTPNQQTNKAMVSRIKTMSQHHPNRPGAQSSHLELSFPGLSPMPQ